MMYNTWMKKHRIHFKHSVILVMVASLLSIGFLAGICNVPKQKQPSQAAASLSDWQQYREKTTTTFSLVGQNGFAITSTEFSESYLHKTFTVKQNTTYSFSADVWTDSTTQNSSPSPVLSRVIINSDANGADEYITPIGGTQRLSFMFNTQNSNTVTLRLVHGHWANGVKGTSHFSNLVLQEMTVSGTTKTWDVLCLTFRNLDANFLIGGTLRNVNISMDSADISFASTLFNRFATYMNTVSNGQIIVNIDIRIINEPLELLSYAGGYDYNAPNEDIYPHAHPHLQAKNYDHVMSILRLSAEDSTYNVPTGWVGLGGGQPYKGVSYSTVLLPHARGTANQNADYYEHVLVHEFLHTIERMSLEAGMDIPWLHDSGLYGYPAYGSTGGVDYFKTWYTAYMNKDVTRNVAPFDKFGLTPESYLLSRYQPVATVYTTVIEVTFTITITVGENGTASESGIITVIQGTNKTITFTPNDGYKVIAVMVNGANIGRPKTYTFTNINANQTLSVQFAVDDGKKPGFGMLELSLIFGGVILVLIVVYFLLPKHKRR